MTRRTTPLAELPLLDLIARARDEVRGHVPEVVTGAMDVDACLREVIAQAIKESPLARWEIAARMGELLNTDITRAQLDAWTAPSHTGHRFPAAYLPAFCRVTGCTAPLELLAERAGVTVFASREVLLARRAQAELRARKAREECRELDRVLATIGGEDA